MGTEILQPQGLLVPGFHVAPPSFYRRRYVPANGDLTNFVVKRRPTSSNNSGYKKTLPKPDKRKSNEAKRVTHGGDVRRKDGGAPAMRQVTILRRGQSYDSLAAKLNGGDGNTARSRLTADDMAVVRTGKIEPRSSEKAPNQIRLSPPPLADVYAGSAFSQSPSPRALPLPSFFNKKQQDNVSNSSSDNPATRELRRLLRLD